MTSRNHSVTQDTTGTLALADLPPDISLDSPIFGSIIELPEFPLISYLVFTPALATEQPAVDPLILIEHARKSILGTNRSRSLVDSLLASVHINQDSASLYVFAISSAEKASESLEDLTKLRFEGLSLSESFSFTPSGLFPCSSSCALASTPCAGCSNPSDSALTPSSSPVGCEAKASAARLLPRKPLRRPFAQFRQAVRDRLVDDLTQRSEVPCLSAQRRYVVRLRDGILLCPIPSSTEWSSGWDHYFNRRPLVHCQIETNLTQISASSSRLVVQPLLRPTHHLPLRFTMPLPEGSPITLLPYGTPAYFLNTFNGPSSALVAQFDEALAGLGAGDWKNVYRKEPQGPPTFVIAWLAVQNSSGEDKGLPIIWPTTLCLSYLSEAPSVHARSMLKHIPELPSQLQASPPPPASTVPLSLLPEEAKSRATSKAPISPIHERKSTSPFPLRAYNKPIQPPSTLSRLPTSEALRTFRALTLSSSSRHLREATSEVSAYVESVARERERERERMRREKEINSIGKQLPLPIPSTSTQVPSPVAEPSAPTAMVTSPTLDRTQNEPLPNTPITSLPDEDEDEEELHPDADVFGDPIPPDNSTPMDTGHVELTHPTFPEPTSAVSVPPSSESVNDVFDSYQTFDQTWAQPQGDFMGMNIGYEMNFNMPMDNVNRTAGPGPVDDFTMDEDFAFTDDDFNFFDGPSAGATAGGLPASTLSSSLPIPSNLMSALTPTSAALSALGISPPAAGDFINGPYTVPQPSGIGQSHSSPWFSQQFGEGFTPVEPIAGTSDVPASSPPRTCSVPSTPAVRLSEQESSPRPENRSSWQSRSVQSNFEPVPFAPSHSAADEKYTRGKFALPSLSQDEDDADGIYFNHPANNGHAGWKLQYQKATDPRVAIVRKLIGQKRRSGRQEGRFTKVSMAWEREHEEWASSSPTAVDEDSSSSKSDSDLDDNDWMDEDSVKSTSRPVTPPPTYLPLGPSLIQTHFQHSRLLPLTRPLRPPGLPEPDIATIAAPMSVPTPVSPAAIFGASEKPKSLEAAAQILVKEVAENPMWAETWRSYTTANSHSIRTTSEVWQIEARKVLSLFKGIGWTSSPLDLQVLLRPGNFLDSLAENVADLNCIDHLMTDMEYLEQSKPPLLTIAKSSTVMQLLPTALPFWEKLGLAPRSGKKDLTAFAFFEAKNQVTQNHVVTWLDRVSEAYAARHLGSHVAGSIDTYTTNGVVPVQFESFRKTLVSFMDSLVLDHAPFVFYIVTPSDILNLSSPVLRLLLSAVKRGMKSRLGAQTLFHFVPEHVIVSGLSDPNLLYIALPRFVNTVYDRALRAVDRNISPTVLYDSYYVQAYLQDPAFALARPSNTNVKFVQESYPRSLDVVDRHMLLHIAYQTSSCGKWLLATFVDERGEAHDLKVWHIPDEAEETFIVTHVWSFTLSLARKASVEWRVVIAKAGWMAEVELDMWIDHLDLTLPTGRDVPAMHISILSVPLDDAWTFLSPEFSTSIDNRPTSPSRNNKNHPGAIFRDVSGNGYVLFPTLPILFPRTAHTNPDETPYIPEIREPPQDDLVLRSLCSSALIHVPCGSDYTKISMLQLHLLHAVHTPDSSYTSNPSDTMQDISKNYRELAELAKACGVRPDSRLPYHIATLENMRMVLSPTDLPAT
ncbi:hypothetical protein K474DRAFT_1584939 [Panus rudis PR-1116 ss-1]|nr:hypothetical protein K474DRAFT_1584939 [Panus rudis PR-1116 ss-1]